MKSIFSNLTRAGGYMKKQVNHRRCQLIKIAFLCMFLLTSTQAIFAQNSDIVLDNCDFSTGWAGSVAVTVDVNTRQEGLGSLVSTGNGTDRFWKAFTPVNVSQLAQGYLKFWFYVSDVTAFTSSGQVEITSSGGADLQEYNWNVNSLGLRNGWNYVVLRIADARTTGGAPDLSRINFFRFYKFMSRAVDTRIDDIRFSLEPVVCDKSLLAVTLNANSPNCSTCTDGNIASFITGGYAPYSYVWSTGATTSSVNGLGIGDYTVTVTDAMGCSVRSGATVKSFCDKSTLRVNLQIEDIENRPCAPYQCANGNITAVPLGGTVPYTYLWDGGSTENQIGELRAGCYGVTVTDAAGCSIKAIGCLGNMPSARCTGKIVEKVKDISCAGASDGSIELSLPTFLSGQSIVPINGVIVEENYKWSDITGSVRNRSGLSPGNYNYSVFVTMDVSGVEGTPPVRSTCVVMNTITIKETAPITVNLNALRAPACPEALNGVIASQVSGGKRPYQYRWDNTGDLVINSCDDASGWRTSSGGIQVDVQNNKEGRGNLVNIGSGTNRFYKQFSPVDASRFANGYLKFWFYVSDITKLTTNGQIELTSSGTWDTQEIHWMVAGLGLHNGWNYVILKIPTSPAADLTKVNFFRFYNFMSGSVETRIDDIRFSNDGGALLDNGDKVAGWTSDSRFQVSIDRQIKREGEGSIRTVGGGAGGTRCSKIFDPIKANVTKETGYLKLWLYVSDVSQFSSNGAIEIASSGRADALELSWRTDRLNLQNGWNSLVLKLSDATSTADGGADLTQINFFRFARNTRSSIITQVDDIRFSDNGNIEGSNGDPNLINVGPGFYRLEVTDAAGCTGSAVFDLRPEVSTTCTNVPCTLTLAFSGDNASCYGLPDGRIYLGVAGGSGQYEYQWSNEATTKDIANLSAGTYTVTVRDLANPNCSGITGQYTIQEPAAVTISVSSSNPNICGNGSVTLTATTSAQRILWFPGGEQTTSIQVRSPGVYVATVQNGNCRNQADITIGHAPANLDIRSSRATICVERREVAVLTSPLVSGNRWLNSNGPTTRSITVSVPGIYNLSVSLDGCSESTGTIEIIADCGGPGGGSPPKESPLCNPTLIPIPEQEESTCQTFETSIAIANAQHRYNEYLGQQKRDFSASYIQHCLDTYEELTLGYTDTKKHFTLFYYDQSGNLTRTVPPAGVQLVDAASLDAVQTARVNNQPGIKPAHKMPTDYQYNSLNQKIYENNPDQNSFEVSPGHPATARYFYDEVGRLVLSQNAEQYVGFVGGSKQYSYIMYDALNRVVEVGELSTSAALPVTQESQIPYETFKTFLESGSRREITKTFYDIRTFNVPVLVQNNLRNRVATVATYAFSSSATYDCATHYSYNAHGYAESVVQDIPSLGNSGGRYKRIDYVFDLVNGNVNELHYQKGQRDQFFHRYKYDADNRMLTAETSRDYIVWDRDAEYKYYPHGSMSRQELGEDRVQGIDYAFTIQGWLKGVNSLTLKSSDDMGGDGVNEANRSTAGKDVFGYGLNYFKSDYQSIGAGDTDVEQMDASITAPNLYDGNITATSSALAPFISLKPQMTQYRYDRLNRLKSSRNFDLTEQTDGTFSATGHNKHRTFVEYDPNGNITRLKRNSNVNTNTQATSMDDLTYIYETLGNGYAKNTNHVKAVIDARTGTPADMGDIKPGQTYNASDPWHDDNNYKYDAMGRLFSDKQEGITTIGWNLYGKCSYILKNPNIIINFKYDGLGNRVMKQVVEGGGTKITTTWYIYDGHGRLMATYLSAVDNGPETFTLTELPIYGKDRIGERSVSVDMLGAVAAAGKSERMLSQSRYEMKDHLGNVKAVVSGEKNLVAGNYVANVLSATEYYPFGMAMPGRIQVNGQAYRFGYNGMERDDEIKGAGNTYDFVGRSAYDPRLGRFVSIDPRFRDFAGMSPYAFAANNPIYFVDEGGMAPAPGAYLELGYFKSFNEKGYFDIFKKSEKAILKAGEVVETVILAPYYAFAAFTRLTGDGHAAGNAPEGSVRQQELLQSADEAGTELVVDAALGLATGAVLKGAGTALFPKYNAGKGLTPKITPKAAAAEEVGATLSKAACFVAGTEILTAGGKFIAIEKIRTEEELYRLPANLIDTEKEKVNPDDLIKIVLDGWELTTTKDQLFYTEDGWKKASELKAGDQIVKIQGGTWEVKQVIVNFNDTAETKPIVPANEEIERK